MTGILTINFNPIVQLTDDQFFELCQLNPEVKFERNATGELVIMSPTGGETGNRNATLTARFVLWNEQAELGVVFDSSTGFNLPNGGDRAPDVAWVRLDRWTALTPEQRRKFPPIAPDFVLELMSPSDMQKELQAKMQEYMASGVQLAWLLNCATRQVEIYRSGQGVEVLNDPATLSGESVLPGFVLDLSKVW